MILIIGCGKLGGNLATRLAKRGLPVTILDHDARNFQANLPRDFQGRILQGMEIDSEVLRRAGIEKAEAVVCVARDESTNMMAADVAKHLHHVPQVVVRIDEPRMAEVYRRNGFLVVSPVQAATDALLTALAGAGEEA